MIAVIAGTGNLPLEACKNLIKQNKDFFVISLFPEDNLIELQKIISDPSKIIIQNFYQASTILNLLKEKHATHVIMIGKVDKRNLLKKVKLDWLAIKLLASLAYKDDKAIMEKILETLKSNGIEVINQNEILDSLFIKPGLICGEINSYIQTNIDLGMQLAVKIAEIGIGQTLVMKDGMIIAVEAIEGTDECIKRGIEQGKENIVICKSAHKNQNNKYDLPTLGTKSLENILPGQVAAIAWQSSKTIIVDKETFIKKAQELNIPLISI
ncbi:TPA: hypothetical protein DEO28_03880 [Candidatus Dependentiae bacterium]|nr:MAG: hypothetical protein UR14_C0006G0013 [candidate division TM6 bacterium GW2011_GWE2_31_21]KKP53564.1 MAG: hypothetical protein UR43_C0004G0105 [candidate division TM6 bacterium GW2011_GWF2_33_332]HBS48195.1 hypothetical protein [Candidatus Dependentiae bacterium]HBZ73621.1 hypothetical protein [Candidatus Dependentiae bacterium]